MSDQPEMIPDDVVLPCGCLLKHTIMDGTKTLTIVPCRTSCVNYRNAIGLAAEQEKPVEYRSAP